jgi:hypothetical protein
MSAIDPFTMVHNAIWSMLTDWSDFATFVKIGNRVTLTGENRDPIKGTVSTDDLPEARLVPSGGSVTLGITNQENSITKRWDLQISTGDQRVDAVLFPVEWAALCALAKALDILTILAWGPDGEAETVFVTGVQLVKLSEGVSDVDMKRGVKGWSTIVTIEVVMYFDQDKMQPA